jgi:transcription initiation factor TFIIIB Brf1 subunit/transcription initiation factor TFIIB
MWRFKEVANSSHIHSPVDRNLAQAMAELDRLSGKVSLLSPLKSKLSLFTEKHSIKV